MLDSTERTALARVLQAAVFMPFASLIADKMRRYLAAPDRALVRDAVMLAQRGHTVALVQRGGKFRVALADSAPDRAELRVLARVGGALVLYRRG